MKYGTQKLVYQVENILYENHIRNGRRRIANEIVDTIMELLEADMNKDWNMGHNFPTELETTVRKLERGLGINLMRDDNAIEVYRWIKEQDEKGKSIQKFIEWALQDEQRKYISKYRFNPGLLKNDYPFAFEDTNGYNPQQLEIGI